MKFKYILFCSISGLLLIHGYAFSSWDQLGKNPQHTGQTATKGPIQYKIAWEFPLGYSGRYSFGAVCDSMSNYYFCGELPTSTTRSIISLDKTGNLRWVRVLLNNTNSFSSPALGIDNQLYISCIDGSVYSYSQSDGTPFWQFKGAGPFYSGPTVDKKGNIFVGTRDGQFYSLDSIGKQRWIANGVGQTYSSAVLSNNNNTVFFEIGYRLYSYSESGSYRWTYIMGSTPIGSPSVDREDNIYIVIAKPSIISINSAGSLRWEMPLGSRGTYFYSTAAISNTGLIYVAADKLYALDKTSYIKWMSKQTFNEYEACPVIIDREENSFVPMLGGDIFSFSNKGDLLWRYNFGIHQSMILTNDSGLFISTIQKSLLLIDSGSSISYTNIAFNQQERTTENSLKVYPNPFRDMISVSYSIKSSANKDIKIWDITGRIVFFRKLIESQGEIFWDGNLDDGNPAPIGCYIIKVGDKITSIIKMQ
ncbi:MAG: PQQ-binding-like beta-propeller repeat protein [Candidatus Coatesbacteria bacterium]|nr:PQQ-binding-like beta-propeller repeat protein [Candidatus Coatesbacteria bacterium]